MEMTKQQFDEFKRRYKKAIKENKEDFVFSGERVLVIYAKQVIEFLQPKFDYK